MQVTINKLIETIYTTFSLSINSERFKPKNNHCNNSFPRKAKQPRDMSLNDKRPACLSGQHQLRDP